MAAVTKTLAQVRRAGAKALLRNQYGIEATEEALNVAERYGVFDSSKAFRQFRNDLADKRAAGIASREGGNGYHNSSLGDAFEKEFYGLNEMGGNIFNRIRPNLGGIKSFPKSNVQTIKSKIEPYNKNEALTRRREKEGFSPEQAKAEDELWAAQDELRKAQTKASRAEKAASGGQGLSEAQMDANEALQEAQEKVNKASEKFLQTKHEAEIDKAYQEEVASGAYSDSSFFGGAGGKTSSASATGTGQKAAEEVKAQAKSTTPTPTPENKPPESGFNGGAGKDEVDDYVDGLLKTNGLKNDKKYHIEDRHNTYKNYTAEMNNAKTEEEKAGVRKKYGIADGADDKAFFKEQINGDPTTMDWIMGNNVPGYAAGTALLGGAVASCFSNKGKMSNSELYGQNF